MASFAHVLSEEDSTAVHAYVISQARASIELCKSEYRKNYPEVIGSACTRPQGTAAAN
jgi:antirestriction protein